MASPTKRLPSHSDKGQNIQVFVRCRPLNNNEKAARSYSVVDTPNSREITIKEKQTSSLTKTFQFDKVFGIQSKQIDVYRSVVEPLIPQVMQGYNCTVFAYGQTGTGKTFTMEGGDGREEPGTTWENDPTAGIIPRALSQLFDELRMQQEAEFSVRVSFLELYNEEIIDLQSAADDLNKLRLYEDSAKKGSVIIQGLEEVQVHNKREVYQILEKGSKKRQTAATMMNAHSSRSHTVFTVTVHMKECSMEGEEVLRIGKLNLVDLAGSENVGRSGAVDKRAREAGNINQSLLTLGRVITCLVERTPHIPYRESKLTRLLQDSLGGRTKTSIIATVSPAGINLEETLSTLDYAHRAKNITNKPEVNQRMSKRAVLKEYTEEIERLRKDLMASREKNGVFIDNTNYQGMLSQREAQEQEIAEKLGLIKALTEEMTKKEQMYEDVAAELVVKTEELEATVTKLTDTEHSLACTRTVLQKTAVEKEEQKHLVEKHQETEEKLAGQARQLLEVADVSTKESQLLHDKLDRLRGIEEGNRSAKADFSQVFGANVEEILASLGSCGAAHAATCAGVRAKLGEQLGARLAALTGLADRLGGLAGSQVQVVGELDGARQEVAEAEVQFLEESKRRVEVVGEEASAALHQFGAVEVGPVLEQMAASIRGQVAELEELQAAVCRDVGGLVASVEAWGAEAAAGVRGLRATVETYADQNTARVESLQQRNREIKESEAKVTALLAALTAGFATHSALLAANTAAIQGGAEEDLEQVQGLVAASTSTVAKVEEGRSEVEARLGEESRRISGYVKERTERCQEANTVVLEQGERVGAATRAHVEAEGARWAEYREEARARAEEHTRGQEEKQRAWGEAAARGKAQLQEQSARVAEEVEEAKDKQEAATRRLATEVEEMGEKMTEELASLQSRLALEQETVATFVSEVLREDQPTGATPARAERPFPRALEATSPAARILQRFRGQAEAAVVAARLPLEDSDTEDSLVSASNPSLSRESSDGELKGRRREGLARHGSQGSQEGRTKRLASNPSSRSNSRQNSAAELRPAARASVTSDLGSEAAADQENADPDFRRPQGSQLPTKARGSRAASPTKAPRGSGLRPPSRTRANHLANHNS